MFGSSIVISLIGHLGVLAMVIAAAMWQPEKPKIYVVNLVPSIAAKGSPTGDAKVPSSREEPAPRVAKFTPAPAETATKASSAETSAIPAPPAPSREAPRPAVAHPAPALPESPAARALPAPPTGARPKLKAPALPEPRTAARPIPEERALPTSEPGLRREPPRPVKLAPTEDATRRLALRDLPTDGARRPTALPGAAPAKPEAPPLPASTPPPRQTALPTAGQKELPSLASPAPVAVPAARPVAATQTAKALPATPPPPATPAALGHPMGSPQGSGTITMNASDFPFAWYLHVIQRKVREKWAPAGHTGRAVVRFEIARDGQVRPPKLENSSGDPVYDQAAMRAITEAIPFPPLPEEFKESVLLIHLGFDFTPDRG
jgi:protein TonB